jgi:hypothetical protein
LRKVVAVALVLIAGAAVVLWFANRLNSWVLGGLIGGLASLLLSIPISWTLFSYFARQHDVQERYIQDHSRRVRSAHATHFSGYLPSEVDADYYDDERAFDEDDRIHEVDGEIYTIVEEQYQPRTSVRNSGWLDEEFGRPAPAPLGRQLPPTASSRRAAENVSPHQLPTSYDTQRQRATRQAEGENRGRRTTAHRAAYPGLPNSQQNPMRSRFRSDALRTARLEAARQNMEEDDTVFPDVDEYEAPRVNPSPRSKRGKESRSERLLPDSSSDDVLRPLLRRAPYTYEDDEVRQEMLRHSEDPLVRRSSRYLRRKNEDQTR